MKKEQDKADFKKEERKLLILDIDETLIYASKEPLNRLPDFRLSKYYVYKRPYLDQFLQEIKDDFLLAIWSSATDDYVEAIVEEIIPKDIKLEFVWGGSRCTLKRNLWDDLEAWDPDNQWQEYYYTKPLKKVKRRGYDLEHIIIVDDTPHKAKQNYGNVIYPLEFTGDMSDNDLELLAKYLKLLKEESKIRSIEKRDWRKLVDYQKWE